uniref:Uncharacterized protein n=1 Tax=Cacopsylla melanoneura TaxID=428564 RepID=A0A8D9A9B6_9HEMI
MLLIKRFMVTSGLISCRLRVGAGVLTVAFEMMPFVCWCRDWCRIDLFTSTIYQEQNRVPANDFNSDVRKQLSSICLGSMHCMQMQNLTSSICPTPTWSPGTCQQRRIETPANTMS